MNYFKVQGAITSLTNSFLTKIGFGNIKSITPSHNYIDITLKDETRAGIKLLASGELGVYW